MLWERMFLWRLRREMEHWEQTGLLDIETLRQLRASYGFEASSSAPAADQALGQWTRWVLYLAIFTFLAAFFSFARSQAVALGPPLRVGVLFLGSMVALLTGSIIHSRRRMVGVVLFILGMMLLPTTFFFAVHYDTLWTLSAPFLWWGGLGLLLSVGFGPLAQHWREEGLAMAALLNGLSVPFLWALHRDSDLLVYPTAAVILALAAQRWRAAMPNTWQAVWGRPLMIVGYGLAIAACLWPAAMRLYGTAWSASLYFLAALYFVMEVRAAPHPVTMAPFVVTWLAGMGALLLVWQVAWVFYPLVWLAAIMTLLGVSLLFFRRQLQAMRALLDTLQALVWISSIGFWLLQPDPFHASGLQTMTTMGYGALGLGLYAIALTRTAQRLRLAYLGAWSLIAAFRLGSLGSASLTLEHYSLLSGALLLLNALAFAHSRQREQAMVPAVALLAIPSLALSWGDGRVIRTVFLALGGIGLIGAGAMARNRYYLLLGTLVLVPAIAIKLTMELEYLGLPRFAWFAIFGLLLVAVAWFLQRFHGAAPRASTSTKPQAKS